MSRLEELISKLCPDGVEYKKLGDIAVILRGASPRPIKNFVTVDKDGVNWIKIGDVTPGSKYITKSEQKITSAGAKQSREVHKGDFILSNSMSFGRPYILNIDGCIHDGWLSLSKFQKCLNTDFLFYVLSSSLIQKEMSKKASFGGAVQNLNADIVKSIFIPLPPLPIQEEIVRILDNFTNLTTELTTELTARKKQYEYYRDTLLTFGDEVEYIPLWSLTIWDKKFNSVDNYKQGKVIKYPSLLAKDLFLLSQPDGDVFLLSTGEQTGWTTEEIAEDYLCKGEVIAIPWGKSRPLKEVIKYYKGKFITSDNRIATSSDTTKLLNKYMYYWLINNSDILDSFYRGSGIKHPDMAKVLNMLIPLPPLSEQERIVEILDRFDKLCNDISEGLPAEIEARKKQYEFYRNKLLNFKELT